jgi:hypothetical protein
MLSATTTRAPWHCVVPTPGRTSELSTTSQCDRSPVMPSRRAVTRHPSLREPGRPSCGPGGGRTAGTHRARSVGSDGFADLHCSCPAAVFRPARCATAAARGSNRCSSLLSTASPRRPSPTRAMTGSPRRAEGQRHPGCGDRRRRLAVEEKMFHNPTPDGLNEQLRDRRGHRRRARGGHARLHPHGPQPRHSPGALAHRYC